MTGLTIVTILGGLVSIIVGFLTISKVLLERTLLPSVQFDIQSKKLGKVKERIVLDTKVQLKNVGSTTLVARNIRLDIKYILDSDFSNDEKLQNDFFEKQLYKKVSRDRKESGVNQKVGRLYFPNTLINNMKISPSDLVPTKANTDKKLKESENDGSDDRGFLLFEDDTFVQPEVIQNYSFTTSVPNNTLCILVWSSFIYVHDLSAFQEATLKLMKRFGLIRHTLLKANKPHVTENVAWIAD